MAVMRGDRIGTTVYVLLLVGVLVWLALIVLAPALVRSTGAAGDLGAILYSFFGKTCHQLDARSFHFLGHKLAVCSRCTMVYAGFLAGLLFFPLFGYARLRDLPRLGLLLGILPMAADALTGISVFWSPSFVTRSVTGFIGGATLLLYILPPLREAAGDLFNNSAEQQHEFET